MRDRLPLVAAYTLVLLTLGIGVARASTATNTDDGGAGVGSLTGIVGVLAVALGLAGMIIGFLRSRTRKQTENSQAELGARACSEASSATCPGGDVAAAEHCAPPHLMPTSRSEDETARDRDAITIPEQRPVRLDDRSAAPRSR